MVADFSVGADETIVTSLVWQACITCHPGWSAAGHDGNSSRDSVRAFEVVQPQSHWRLKRGEGTHRCGGTRHIKNSERIIGNERVAPCPKKFPLVHGILHAV